MSKKMTVAVLLFVWAGIAEAARQAATMKVETFDGSQSMTIVLQGATRNDDIVAMATSLQELRRSLAKPRPGQSAEQLEVARDAYDEAVRQLIALNDLVTHTSAPPDAARASSVRRLAADTKKVLGASGEPPDNVTTQIDAAMPTGYRVFYVSAKKRAAASESEWQSYTFGQLLHIGTYVFRIVAPETRELEEVVVVFDDPTRRTINRR